MLTIRKLPEVVRSVILGSQRPPAPEPSLAMLPRELEQSLLPFQREGVQYVLVRK